MKKIIVLSILLSSLFTHSQIAFDLTGGFSTIKREKLERAGSLNDIISNYPVNWISGYKSVEVITTNNGISKTASGSDNHLTAEQKKNLKTAELLSNVFIKVNYVSKNSLNGKLESHLMEVSLYIAPDVNAKFEAGSIHDYLKNSVLGSVKDSIPKRLSMVTVKFTVNENGDVVNTKVFKSSGDTFNDMRLLNAVNSMPQWKPAENKGVKIRQEFLFSFGGC